MKRLCNTKIIVLPFLLLAVLLVVFYFMFISKRSVPSRSIHFTENLTTGELSEYPSSYKGNGNVKANIANPSQTDFHMKINTLLQKITV